MFDELKPCPFCGGEAMPHIGIFARPYFVRCLDCGCLTMGHDTEHEAIKAWNTRTEPVFYDCLTQKEAGALLSGLSKE